MIINGNLILNNSNIESLGDLEKVNFLGINYCNNLKDLGKLKTIKNIHLLEIRKFPFKHLDYLEEASVLDLHGNETIETINSLKKVNGNLDLRNCKKLKSLNSLEKVLGFINFSNCSSLITAFENLKISGKWINLTNCESLQSLGRLEKVNGFLNLENCASLQDLGNLKEVDGDILLDNCKNFNNLGKLEKVKGTIYIYNSGITKEYMKKYKPQLNYR